MPLLYNQPSENTQARRMATLLNACRMTFQGTQGLSIAFQFDKHGRWTIQGRRRHDDEEQVVLFHIGVHGDILASSNRHLGSYVEQEKQIICTLEELQVFIAWLFTCRRSLLREVVLSPSTLLEAHYAEETLACDLTFYDMVRLIHGYYACMICRMHITVNVEFGETVVLQMCCSIINDIANSRAFVRSSNDALYVTRGMSIFEAPTVHKTLQSALQACHSYIFGGGGTIKVFPFF